MTNVINQEEKIEDLKMIAEFTKIFKERFGNIIEESNSEEVFRDYIGYGAESLFIINKPKNFKETKHIKNLSTHLLWLDTSINPNGITGVHDIGRTYTIKFECMADVREKFKHSFNRTSYVKFYKYARTIEEVIKSFDEFLKECDFDFTR